MDVEVSACDEILYVEVEADGVSMPIFATQVQRSGVRVIEIIPNYPLTLNLTLEPGDYSMLVAVRAITNTVLTNYTCVSTLYTCT